ncbi:hypothetical protein [Niabella aquatica]
MKRIIFVSELLLGISFVFGAVNGLLIPFGYKAIIPVNPGSAFATVLSQTNYIFILQKLVELLFGILLLTRRLRFLCLVALAPIVVSILLYHLFDDTDGRPVGISVFILYAVSLSGHKESLYRLFQLK